MTNHIGLMLHKMVISAIRMEPHGKVINAGKKDNGKLKRSDSSFYIYSELAFLQKATTLIQDYQVFLLQIILLMVFVTALPTHNYYIHLAYQRYPTNQVYFLRANLAMV